MVAKVDNELVAREDDSRTVGEIIGVADNFEVAVV
jgi:hypothetical protein